MEAVALRALYQDALRLATQSLRDWEECMLHYSHMKRYSRLVGVTSQMMDDMSRVHQILRLNIDLRQKRSLTIKLRAKTEDMRRDVLRMEERSFGRPTKEPKPDSPTVVRLKRKLQKRNLI